MEPYFQKFPALLYNGTLCRNITRRVKISEELRNALTLYYTYEVKDGTRADLIPDAYYEDPTLDWMLWLTNQTVDPYYNWNLSVNDFETYLIKKYGSIENSIKRIAYYRNNWYNDDNILTTDFYDNHLEHAHKKYYAPFYGKGTSILHWKRREEDWVMETNKIYKLSIANTEPFIVGELVDVENNLSARTGGGEITAISNTYIMIKNIDGSFNVSDNVEGETSQIPQSIAAVDLVYEAIADDEGVFWSPVTYYDIENERNAYNRTINILDKNHLPNAVDQLNAPFRLIARECGSGLTTTEEMDAASLLMNTPHADAIAAYEPEERPLAMQLLGKDPDILVRAAVKLAGLGADIVVETASSPAVFPLAIEVAAARGRVSFFGLYPEATVSPLTITRSGLHIF